LRTPCIRPMRRDLPVAGRQNKRSDRIHILGAIDLASGHNRMIGVVTVDAVSTIRLPESIEALYPLLTLIHAFLDNARWPDWCRNGLLDRVAGPSRISFRPNVRISIRSSGCGVS
jgi:hypothetical protein